MSTVIEATGIGRRYRHGIAESGPRTWRNVLSKRRPSRDLRPLWALRNVSFGVGLGRSVGLVGPNGAGKSTLLKLLGGIGLPDEGTLRVDGRVAAMFELGQDFHPDLTGRDNIQTAGVIAGFSRRDVQRRLPDVIEFAGLGRFIDSPLRVYSSGMKARLAFSVAIHTEPEVLLIDEVLAVGDVGFQLRCRERLSQLRDAGVTIVLASHSVEEVQALCDEVIWLRGGRVVACGPPGRVLERYAEITAKETRLATPAITLEQRTPSGVRLDLRENRFGTLEATIDYLHIMDCWGHECSTAESGTPVQLRISTSVPEHLQPAILSVKLIRDRDGLVCVDTSTQGSGKGNSISFTADFGRLDLGAGDYSFDVGLHSADWDRTFDFHKSAYHLRITSKWLGEAVLAPPVGWSVSDPEAASILRSCD